MTRLSPEVVAEVAAEAAWDVLRLRAEHAPEEIRLTAELRRLWWEGRIEKALAAAQRRARS